MLYVAAYVYIRLPVEHPTVEITIDSGTSVRQIAEVLENAGVIDCAFCFKAYIAVMGLSSKIRAGDYEFESGQTAKQVISMLLKGDFKTYRLTIPEGWTVRQITDYIKGLQFVDGSDFAERFLALSKDPEFIKELDIGWIVPGLEGYLFPSTYEVYKLKDPKKLLLPMVQEFKSKFAAAIKEKGGILGLTPGQIVTLASIIEKETSVPAEKPLVASVFYNRLKKGMLLQSDPTIIYGLPDFDGNIKKTDITNPHKYNTYVHLGLPPGPICNPGEDAIEAALNPATADYLYFVSKNDGTHIFSNSYDEHLRAVGKYQR